MSEERDTTIHILRIRPTKECLIAETAFTIPDGGSIEIVDEYGNSRIVKCEFVEEHHTRIGGQLFHNRAFAERMFFCNQTVRAVV